MQGVNERAAGEANGVSSPLAILDLLSRVFQNTTAIENGTPSCKLVQLAVVWIGQCGDNSAESGEITGKSRGRRRTDQRLAGSCVVSQEFNTVSSKIRGAIHSIAV